jgi:hypothetical protein
MNGSPMLGSSLLPRWRDGELVTLRSEVTRTHRVPYNRVPGTRTSVATGSR